MFPCSHNLLRPRPQAFSWPVSGVEIAGKAQESGGKTARGGVRREGEEKGIEGYCSFFQAFR